MRVSLGITLALPFALTGCPALLSDWTIRESSASSAVDASVDATGGGAAGGSPDSNDSGTLGSGGGSGSGGSSGSSGFSGSTGGSSGGTGGASGGARSTGGNDGTSGDAAAVVDACSPVTHDNALGQTWQDCVALGTYDQAQAMKACAASGAGICMVSNGCGFIEYAVRGYTSDGSTVVGSWGYGGAEAGYVSTSSDPCGGGSNPGNLKWY